MALVFITGSTDGPGRAATQDTEFQDKLIAKLGDLTGVALSKD